MLCSFKKGTDMTDQRVWTHGAPVGYGIIFLRRGGEKLLVFRGGHPDSSC